MSENTPHRVLIIGPSWVGDMVMAQSLFKTIKQRFSDTCIDVLAPEWSRPLLSRMPEVNHSISMPVGHGQLMLKERYQLGKSLRGKYNQAILLPNSLKSALVPAFANIPLRTGWRGEMRYGLVNDLRKLDKQRYPLMVERFVALAYACNASLPRSLPYPELVVEEPNIAPLLEQFQLNTDRPVLVLCPGAEFGPAKRWPENHYAAVASEKIRQGWQVWVMGSEKDKSVSETIFNSLAQSEQPYCRLLAGNTRLGEAIDLMSLAGAVVSNDSGLMHIAAALNRPLVAVYGSTSPGFTPPLGDQVQTVSISVDCGPCFKRECPLQHPSEHMKCLRDLSADQVLQALEQLIDPTKSGER